MYYTTMVVTKMPRICITLPQELLNELDDVLKENGYTSRRTGVQDAIKEYIKHLKT